MKSIKSITGSRSVRVGKQCANTDLPPVNNIHFMMCDCPAMGLMSTLLVTKVLFRTTLT